MEQASPIYPIETIASGNKKSLCKNTPSTSTKKKSNKVNNEVSKTDFIHVVWPIKEYFVLHNSNFNANDIVFIQTIFFFRIAIIFHRVAILFSTIPMTFEPRNRIQLPFCLIPFTKINFKTK